VVQPNTRNQNEWKEMAEKCKGSIMGKQEALETFHPLTHIKWK
jgi:hypothetical protein